MKAQQKIKAFNIAVTALYLFAWACPIQAQTYSEDFEDMDWALGANLSNLWTNSPPKDKSEYISPIGNLGNIQTVIDLRSFIPVSARSHKKRTTAQTDGGPLRGGKVYHDIHQWYQYPTRKGIALFYYGNTDKKTLANLSNTIFLTEDKLTGQYLQWAKFAYGLAMQSGKELYKSVSGDSDLDGAEPIAVLLTSRSAVILINFKYTDFDRYEGTGQVLAAFEFSRALKEYKSFYDLRSSRMFNRSTVKAFEGSLPIVTTALKLYF